MFGILLIGVALCVLGWLYVRWSRVRQFWAQRGVPHLPPHPVMGSLTFLQRQNPGKWLINSYQHFNKTPYFGAWWFWRPTLIINSPEIARNVLVKDFASFRDRLLGSGTSDPIGHLNIFTVNEPLWSSIRRRLTNIFTAAKLRALQNLLDTKANQLVERIKNTENKTAISLRMLFTDYTSDVIGTAAFGVETKISENKTSAGSALYAVLDLIEMLCARSAAGRVLVQRDTCDAALRYLLLDTADRFVDIVQQCRSVIVAGGTMEPIGEFRALLDKGPGTRVRVLQCAHAAPPDRVLALCVARGPANCALNFSYEQRMGKELFPKWATDYFTKVFRLVSEQRRAQRGRTGETKDLVDALIKLKEESDQNNEGLTEDTIVAQAAIFLLGGFETSGAALSFALYELAFHPEIQEKMFQELVKIKEQDENGNLDISKLTEAPYFNSVIKEVLRKYSPMGWLDRIAVQDYKIDDNLTIEAGTPICVNAIGMHYDENYFPNPLEFNPERFMPENEKNITPFSYLPFGEGPRNCIGKRFGQISVRHALAHVALHFKVKPLANGPKPSEVEFEKHGLFLVPGQDLYVDFIPRN
ncbi:cytochrome P450 6j1-like [Zerene cesonia]|uniref:cytochrome P450 6j1-like n=1 Tax=Zerene cesonia TaxID=33412 RepID=UPI0018E4DF09|nr:cytochrome P450 6j1-like [Zerene cesonia]